MYQTNSQTQKKPTLLKKKKLTNFPEFFLVIMQSLVILQANPIHSDSQTIRDGVGATRKYSSSISN